MQIDNEKLLTIKETARRLGCGTTTAWALIRERSLPAVRIRGAVRIRPKDIEKYEQAHPY